MGSRSLISCSSADTILSGLACALSLPRPVPFAHAQRHIVGRLVREQTATCPVGHWETPSFWNWEGGEGTESGEEKGGFVASRFAVSWTAGLEIGGWERGPEFRIVG